MQLQALKGLAKEGIRLRKEKKVFSLKTTVVCLTVKKSFPRTQKQQLTFSLKKPASFLESGGLESGGLESGGLVSEERPNACMIFLPTELYVGLIKKMAKYEIGKSSAILDSINEDLHNQGFIDDETYFKFKDAYMKRLIDVVREREESSVKVEVKSAKLEVQQSTVQVSKPKKRPDYSKMSLEELEKLRSHLLEIGDPIEVQHVAFEIKKRKSEV
ncbi:MAG: hypothetical protein QXU45_01910 [Candidatus Bathyarchaeia archaeon]